MGASPGYENHRAIAGKLITCMRPAKQHPRLSENEVQRELEFSEGTSAKCIFDVEIEKLRAEVFNL